MNTALVEAGTALALVLLSIAIICAFFRLVRGPTLSDRIVALDAIAAMLVSMSLVQAIATGLAVFIDVALTIALVSFLGTVAVARAIESGDLE